MKISRSLLVLPLAAVLLVCPLPASAQEGGQEAGAGDSAGKAKQETKEERKARMAAEKEARIQAYLDRKAEKQAQKEARRAERDTGKETRKARAAATKQSRPEPAVREEKPARKAGGGRASRRGAGSTRVGGSEKNLPAVVERLRTSALRGDPEAVRHLNRVVREDAGATELGEFAGYLAERGFRDDSVIFYRAALRDDPENIPLWYNLGSVQVLRKDYSAAGQAFDMVLGIDPNHARAHYGLGTVYGVTGRYDEAIESYHTALTLNPDLGDPSKNPQAANNELLIPVKLMIYETKAESLGLPLQDVSEDRTGDN